MPSFLLLRAEMNEFPTRARTYTWREAGIWYTQIDGGEPIALDPTLILPDDTPTRDVLADAAWRGIEAGILGHISPAFVSAPTRFHVLDVAIADTPACPGARVIRWWEDS